MPPSRRSIQSIRRYCLMVALLTLLSGQAAFAWVLWSPVYVDDEYMGCQMDVPLSPNSSSVVSPNSIGPWECRFLQWFGLGTNDGGPRPSDAVLQSASTFVKDSGLDSDSDVQKATSLYASKMRQQSEDLQAAALAMAKAAREMEALTTLSDLEKWIAKQVSSQSAPVCPPSNP